MISCWGSSETMGAPAFEPYASLIGPLLGAPVFNGGVSGETSRQIRARFEAAPARWSDVTIIWMGRLNYHEPDQVIEDHERMIELLPHYNFLVLAAHNTKEECSRGYEWCRSLNERLAKLAGPNWFNQRRLLIDEGLRAAQIVPTEQDLIDIDRDIVPSSLRCDVIHINSQANRVIARWLADEILSRGWLTSHALEAA